MVIQIRKNSLRRTIDIVNKNDQVVIYKSLNNFINNNFKPECGILDLLVSDEFQIKNSIKITFAKNGSEFHSYGTCFYSYNDELIKICERELIGMFKAIPEYLYFCKL